MIWEMIHLAILAIGRNALRSVLTFLGVVIGVAAVIALASWQMNIPFAPNALVVLGPSSFPAWSG